jgi:hypothetical protein
MAYTTINKPSEYFNTKLWTGNGSTQSITGINFQPDLAWIKQRGGTTDHHLYDAVRGVTKAIASNNTDAETTKATGLTAFDTNGFTLGADNGVNGSSNTYVGWSWLGGGTGVSNTDGDITSTVSASTTSGFSIVKWTGDGSASGAKTVGHSLGVTPKFVIAKKTSASASWWIGIDIDGWNWNTDYINFTTTAKQSDASGTVFYSAPTSSIINLGSEINASSADYIAYVFAEKKGFSKFGSYVGNGNADGTFIYTGFKPAMIIFKIYSGGTGSWVMYDNKRNTFNVVNSALFPDLSNAEETADNGFECEVDMLSNGFKLRGTGNAYWMNYSGWNYMYMAFAENPLVGTNNIPATAR